jgi:hypothetical protein
VLTIIDFCNDVSRVLVASVVENIIIIIIKKKKDLLCKSTCANSMRRVGVASGAILCVRRLALL